MTPGYRTVLAMRDKTGPFDGHACLVEAGKRVLIRASQETLSWWLDCSIKTIGRMATCDSVATCEQAWTIARFVRLIRFEVEQLGTATLSLALASIADGVKPPRGDALHVRADLVHQIQSDAEIQQRIAAALSEGSVSRRNAAQLLAAIERRRLDEEQRLIPNLIELIGAAQ